MKFFQYFLFQAVLIVLFCAPGVCAPKYGFSLPDSISEMTIRYRTIRNLILLPVVINDSITVNLVLDTGCRNLVLFGKRFKKLFILNPNKQVLFSGLGSGKSVQGFLSLSNKVSIQQVLGERIPVVVVPVKNVFSQYTEVHGVIGYDIFQKFEIELNPRKQTITFRPAAYAVAPTGFSQVALKIVDSRPVVDSEIALTGEPNKKFQLMIDTGSALGLLLKTTTIEEYDHISFEKIIGFGFNGPLAGYKTFSDKVKFESFEMLDLPTGIVESPWHNYASIGMEVLKDYILVLNYCKQYACFKTI